jgi:ornithine decarboxylase
VTKKCLAWLEKNSKNSPNLVIDLEEVKNNYKKFIRYFKGIKPFYAVKANPNKNIIIILNELGCSFDCASIKEIKDCIKLGVDPKKISYGNTIKKSVDIKTAFLLGINLFAFDCEAELFKISNYARGSKVFCRIQVPNGGAEWPLSKKFGCSVNSSEKLLMMAIDLKLKPIGLSFHVGSQQLFTKTWDKAIKLSSNIYKKLAKKKVKLNFINLGGGIPADYLFSKINIRDYANDIKKSLKKYFGKSIPSEIIIEPGRFLVASAGVLEAEIILVTDKNYGKDKWVYLDIGRYNGLAETEGEAIKYKIKVKGYYKYKTNRYILAGPSCDGHDILYEKFLYELPQNLKIGDRVRIFSAGAYTTAYQSNFNGIKSIKETFIE